MQEVFAHVLKKDHISISTLDASEPPTLAKVPQFSVLIPSVKDTFNAVSSLLMEEINATEGDPKIIVFGTTANLVALYAKVFKNQLKLPVYELHSRLSQPARTKTTDSFKVAKTGILFASDGEFITSPIEFKTHGTLQLLVEEWIFQMCRLCCKWAYQLMQTPTPIVWVELLGLVKMDAP